MQAGKAAAKLCADEICTGSYLVGVMKAFSGKAAAHDASCSLPGHAGPWRGNEGVGGLDRGVEAGQLNRNRRTNETRGEKTEGAISLLCVKQRVRVSEAKTGQRPMRPHRWFSFLGLNLETRASFSHRARSSAVAETGVRILAVV